MADQLDMWKIREAIAESGKTRIGEIMSYLKYRYDGRYDVKMAREQAREMVKEMR